MPRVALLLPAGKTYRELLRGILQFARLNGPWAIQIYQGRPGEQKLLRTTIGDYDGIIGRINDRYVAKHLLAGNLPAIITNSMDEVLATENPLSRLSCFACDNDTIGRCAAEYFLDRKFRHFAFIGEVNRALWSEERRAAFLKRLKQERFSCVIYPQLASTARKDFGVEQAQLCDWLKALPKPVAIFVANDLRGRQVVDSCLKAGVAVPQEAAVLSVDNDELLCETATPQMSSIQMNTEQGGFEAARALDKMMSYRGRRSASRQTVITYGFSSLVTRRSTETVQVSDILVTRALEFIRINAGRTVKVNDLVRHLHASRRTLETRFKTIMGSTIYAEMMRVRLERVQTLLSGTSLTVQAIAGTCGFASASHLGHVFRHNYEMTLSAFRRKSQARAK